MTGSSLVDNASYRSTVLCSYLLRLDTKLVGELGVPIVATVLLDPAIARAVDAGLMLARLPAAFRHAVRLAA